MSETWVIISINRIFQLNKYNEETYYYTIMTNNYFQIITLIGISANAMGQSQSLNTLSKNITYLESISLRNRLLTYWSVTKTKKDF
jgi:hypothetical protein